MACDDCLVVFLFVIDLGWDVTNRNNVSTNETLFMQLFSFAGGVRGLVNVRSFKIGFSGVKC